MGIACWQGCRPRRSFSGPGLCRDRASSRSAGAHGSVATLLRSPAVRRSASRARCARLRRLRGCQPGCPPVSPSHPFLGRLPSTGQTRSDACPKQPGLPDLLLSRCLGPASLVSKPRLGSALACEREASAAQIPRSPGKEPSRYTRKRPKGRAQRAKGERRNDTTPSRRQTLRALPASGEESQRSRALRLIDYTPSLNRAPGPLIDYTPSFSEGSKPLGGVTRKLRAPATEPRPPRAS